MMDLDVQNDDSSIPTPPPRVRFVVLRHVDRAGVHFDLMIDQGPTLATWKCAEPPEQAEVEDLDCTRLGDHRRTYLDYEGPISGDRGEVTRYDTGHCVINSRQRDSWEVTFAGTHLVGRYHLRRMWHRRPACGPTAGQHWRLHFLGQ